MKSKTGLLNYFILVFIILFSGCEMPWESSNDSIPNRSTNQTTTGIIVQYDTINSVDTTVYDTAKYQDTTNLNTTAVHDTTNNNQATVINPKQITGLRSWDGGKYVIVLAFPAVKTGTEDRTIAHFDISRFSKTASKAILNIPIRNIDKQPKGIFNVYYFKGDGFVSEDEWDAGADRLVYSFLNIDEGIHILNLDVTQYLVETINSGNIFMSFNFIAGSDAHFDVGPVIYNFPIPVSLSVNQ